MLERPAYMLERVFWLPLFQLFRWSPEAGMHTKRSASRVDMNEMSFRNTYEQSSWIVDNTSNPTLFTPLRFFWNIVNILICRIVPVKSSAPPFHQNEKKWINRRSPNMQLCMLVNWRYINEDINEEAHLIKITPNIMYSRNWMVLWWIQHSTWGCVSPHLYACTYTAFIFYFMHAHKQCFTALVYVFF